MTEAHDVRMLRGPAATLAVASGIFGAVPAMPCLGRVLNGRILGYDLATAAQTAVSVGEEGTLIIQAEGLDACEEAEPHPNETAVSLELDTGLLTALWSSASRTERHHVTFVLDRWTWQCGPRPVAWTGVLRGARVWRGNAIVETSVDGKAERASQVECFEGGGLRWIVVPRRARRSEPERCDVIVEALDGEVDSDRLRDALRALSFVLGRRVALDTMVGVDQALRPVAAMAVMPESGTGEARPPVPLTVPRNERWDAEFFRRLADRIREDEARDADVTHIVTSAYLAATSEHEHIEGAFLKLQVALEAFCLRADRQKPPKQDARADATAWNAWVDRHADEIRRLALTEADAEPLIKLVRGACRPPNPSSRIVEQFFARRHIELPDTLRPAIAGRNKMVHEFTFGHRSKNFERELNLVAASQTLLVAALALFIGFEGPITRERDWYESPEWWPWKPRVAPPPGMVRCVAEAAELETLVALQHDERRTVVADE